MKLSLKSVGKALKKVAKVAAPIVGAFNPALGIGLGMASGLGEGKKSFKSMAMGGAGGALGAVAGGGLSKIGGLKSLGGLGKMGQAGGFGKVLGGVGGFAKANPELILGGLQAYQGAKQSARANELDKRALSLAEQPWNETAGLRQQALGGLMNKSRPDLGSIYGGSSNPFTRPQRSPYYGG